MKIQPATLNFKANKMSKAQACYFKDNLQSSKSVDIICHESTDRDSLNSAIAMQRYMDSLGVNSRIIISQKLQKIGVINPDFRYIQANQITPEDKPEDTVLCVDFSAKERVSPVILNYIQKADNVLCIDHHDGTNLFEENFVILKKPVSNPDEELKNIVPCYVDSTAKSATSVIYRMFEALDEPVDSNQAYSLMFGFADDTAKKGYIKCDGKKGTITPTDKLIQDKNAYEVFNDLIGKLSEEQIKKIAQAVDVKSTLTPLEEDFNNSLVNRIQFSENGKIAYVEIPPDDCNWQELNKKNSRTKAIMSHFRQDVLDNKFDDERLNNVELALTFYEMEGNYRISAHSKQPTLKEFFNYVDTKIPNFDETTGGHEDRRGGKKSADNLTCHQWVQAIVSCDDFYN